ncbi:MAG: hypothetical protein JWQ07_234 [Ramlibacter sp.]|nr:hypothetical protein [Ramlibacter sp.]
MAKILVMCVATAALLCGCASAPAVAPAASVAPAPAPAPAAAPAPASAAAATPHYHCDQGFDFTVRFIDDTAVLDAGPRGNDVLLRDAGGATPLQTVYSNLRMRAEFGLGAGGREALLRYAAPPLVAHCMQG